MTMEQRITWTRNTGVGRTGWDGTVGGRRLFTLDMSVTRGEGWILRTRLPFNLVPERSSGPDSDEVKAYAERVLLRFVETLGAAFK
jgi:hypothetical protein